MAQRQQYKSFNDMIENASTPILVDFYASWCGPCRIMAGVLDQVKQQVGDSVSIVKIDTEKYPSIASEWQIHALPTLILFNKGALVERIEGVVRPQELVQRLQSVGV